MASSAHEAGEVKLSSVQWQQSRFKHSESMLPCASSQLLSRTLVFTEDLGTECASPPWGTHLKINLNQTFM